MQNYNIKNRKNKSYSFISEKKKQIQDTCTEVCLIVDRMFTLMVLTVTVS